MLLKKIIALSTLCLFFLVPTVSFAYTTLWDSTSFGLGTAVSVVSVSSNSQWLIDCSASGWSEISSIQLNTKSTSGTRNIYFADLARGTTTDTISVSTVQTDRTWTFTPALWCLNRTVVLKALNPSGGGNMNVYSTTYNTDILPLGFRPSVDPSGNISSVSALWGNYGIITGSYSTATPVFTGTTTQIYELYPVSTTSDLSTSTVLFPFEIFLVFLLSTVFFLHYVWRVK